MSFDSTQYMARNCGGKNVEFGEQSFTTTGTTVEVTTKMTKVYGATLSPKVTMGNNVERLYCDKTITSGAVTVTREVEPYQLSANCEDTAFISSNDWANVPVGYVHTAGQISRLTVYNKTKNGGTPYLLLGTLDCVESSLTYDHTGAANGERNVAGTAGDFSNLQVGDYVYVTGTNITSGFATVAEVAADGSWMNISGHMATGDNSDTAITTVSQFISATETKTPPADGAVTSVTAVGDFVGPALPTVRVGQFLVLGTSGGGSSDPSGLWAEVEITPTPTSGLTFNYVFWGI